MAYLENLTEAVVLWENGFLSRQYGHGRNEELLNFSGRDIPENALRGYLSVNPSKISDYKLYESKNPKLTHIVLNAINYGGENVRKMPYGQKREIVEAIYKNFEKVEGEEACSVRKYCERCLSSLESRTKWAHPESTALGTMDKVIANLKGRERWKAEKYEDFDALHELA
ncbi:MAG: hypothetical protein AABX65_04655 [Nanoarchaeota archaeon]